MAPRRRVWMALLLGAAAGLGQAPVSLPWVTLIALGLALALHLWTESPKQAAAYGWAFGAGYFAVTLHWIVEPFFVDVVRHGWMAPFALLGMAGGLALFWGAAAWAAKRVRPADMPGALAWAVTLALAELARSYVLTGFPWALIGHVWIGWWPMHMAAWIGPHGLTLYTLAFAVSLLWLVRRHRPFLLLVPVALLLLPLLTQFKSPEIDTGQSVTVRMVQPNAPQHLKWHPDHVRGFFDRAVSYTEASAEQRPDLIIWPETSVPALLENAEVALGIIGTAADGVPVVLGIQRRRDARYHNSLAVLGADGTITATYDKHHLVPFGEYMPAGDFLARFGITAFAAQAGNGYSPGSGPALLDLGALGNALPLICYEAIFPQHFSATPDRPDWLLQITNDAWFGNWVGPYQHLAQARLRAVEQGLPMVRVANTG
ncbi:MAG: apolipoprotein N-acyltransferase, partial [Pseudomonadota bacterium]